MNDVLDFNSKYFRIHKLFYFNLRIQLYKNINTKSTCFWVNKYYYFDLLYLFWYYYYELSNHLKYYCFKKISVILVTEWIHNTFFHLFFPAVPNQRAKGKEQSAMFFPGTAGFSFPYKIFVNFISEYKSAFNKQAQQKNPAGNPAAFVFLQSNKWDKNYFLCFGGKVGRNWELITDNGILEFGPRPFFNSYWFMAAGTSPLSFFVLPGFSKSFFTRSYRFNGFFRRTCIQRESLLCAWSPPLNIFVFPAVPRQIAKCKEQRAKCKVQREKCKERCANFKLQIAKSFRGAAGSFYYAKKSNLKYTTATKQTYSEKITMKTQTFQKTINKTVVYHSFHSLKGVPHA